MLHTSVGGARLRLRLTNTFGAAPLAVERVTVARSLAGPAIVRGTSRTLTFGGRGAVTVPAGARVLSDAADLTVPADGDVVVSLYLRAATGPATWHQLGQQDTWISSTGDHTADVGGTAFSTTVQSFFFVDGLDVAAGPRLGAVVTLGDSITDGYNSTPNSTAAGPTTWRGGFYSPRPNSGKPSTTPASRGTASSTTDGVRDVILLEGINDIGFSQLTNPETAPHTDVSAEDIIFGMKQLIASAHLRGLRILGGTLTPFGGADYFSAAGEVKRQAVNAWIRDRSRFDGVIDFDRVVRDPAAPERFLPVYASGDHLHPSDAGYAAMADAIDLGCLSGKEVVPPDASRRDCTLPPDEAAAIGS